ncbi:MAG TPA: thiolase family protein [Paracoccus sp. (in: a-proteobacteria)]|uniref:thiolase family protein n=1 Tax=Paracoccus sp. TaxID=267 RepID=UPI002B6FA1E9|nr:thiolase family protein [Paracoccus sp. (in: a-proteobacteria)]HWL56832.1 thiolase family protein [Paracoccus sp. (in: a-proteobacteria)]
MSIVIAGFGTSSIERRSDRGILVFAQAAIIDALRDANLARDEVDGYIGAPFATNAGSPHAEGGDEVSVRTISQAMGFKHLRHAADLFRRYPADMVANAAQALIAGQTRYVVGLRALYNLQGRDYATSDADVAYGVDQFAKPFGYNIAGARFAVRAQRYMALNGATRADLYEIVSLARRNSALNPQSVWKGKTVDLDAYMAAPMVSSPHGLFDCDMPVCGAAAFVMCREEDLPAGAQPAHVTGWAGFQNPGAVFSMSGRRPEDLASAQLYDGFSSMVWDWLEAFGICPEGKAWQFVREGGAELDGRLPLNTFGGSLGEGRLHGMGHLREAYLQASGKAGPRQTARSGPCLVQIGPFDDSAFVMLEPEPRRCIASAQ